MKTWLAFLMGLLVAWSPVSAQEVKVRTSMDTKEEFWVGQRLTLVVELLAPGYFASAASFHVPDPAGMLLIPPSGSPLVSGENVDGVDYTVQRYEFSVIARRNGQQEIPPIAASFQFKRQPLDKVTVPATVKTTPLSFVAKTPPGAEKLGNVISARNLKVVETWKPEPAKAKAGDAFTRTIEFTAPDVPAMAFPPFPSGKMDGLGVYPKPPEVLDRSDRGSFTGDRRDTITYVCQRPGQFTIPAVSLTWFNLDTKKLETIVFPARTFDVAPNPAMAVAAADAPAKDSSNERALLLGLLGALAVCGCAVLAAKSWHLLQPVFDWFRPVHLAALNPPDCPEGRPGR